MTCYSPGHVRYEVEVCLQKHHIWIVTDLCSFVVIFTFMFIYQSIIDSIDLLFIQYLSFFFSTSFPKIIFFIFYDFVVYEPAEWNFIFLACREHKTRKIFFFNWLHFFFSWLFLYHKEVTQVFSSTLNFAWQFSYQWNRRSAILPQTQIGKFGRTKFDTHTVLSRDEVLISLIILLQVLLSSWRSARKVQLCFLCKLAFHLQNCRIQQKLNETHKIIICLWLERIRSSHKKFAYLLYNWTGNTSNSQNLAS